MFMVNCSFDQCEENVLILLEFKTFSRMKNVKDSLFDIRSTLPCKNEKCNKGEVWRPTEHVKLTVGLDPALSVFSHFKSSVVLFVIMLMDLFPQQTF